MPTGLAERRARRRLSLALYLSRVRSSEVLDRITAHVPPKYLSHVAFDAKQRVSVAMLAPSARLTM
jgi:hypothetical protein